LQRPRNLSEPTLYPRDLPRLKPLLPGIKTPVLVLAGRDDSIVPPSNGELLAS
jgi:pimeloyl-ACP methyl ester carboxylesterase